ncbi:MAG: hypothetical protein K9M95_04250 [Candidatus Cloacimonetes bacterium]|nr:hypothetical protein [Candidatus Cloacimonadota bacterium]MCF7883321.1 hypothetical protein [Candidatus Cloacimonadota bacterium]
MSNKFRIILYRIGLILFLTGFINSLFGFAPAQKDFSNKYQYDLYRSWLQKGDFFTQKPATFSKEKITKHFGENDEITVNYYLEDGKIFDQQESLSYLFSSSQSNRLLPIVQYFQSFIYRLNAADKRFYYDFLSLGQFKLIYKQKTGEVAENQLWNDYQNERIDLSPLEILVDEEKIVVNAKITKIHYLSLIFPIDFDLQKARKQIEQMEEKKSFYLEQKTELMMRDDMLFADYDFSHQKSKDKKIFEQLSTPQIAAIQDSKKDETNKSKTNLELDDEELPDQLTFDHKEKESSKDSRNKILIDADTTFTKQQTPEISIKPKQEFYSGMPINEYLRNNLYSEISRELLHNKISDPILFLTKEFKGYGVFAKGDTIFIEGKDLKEDFHADLKLQVIRDADGLEFIPLSDYILQDKILKLSQNEEINLSNLSQAEAEIVASRLPQLIYEHRSLGTKLLNFLLIHDDIPSTLIIQNSKRTIYEKESYADLLLLLNRYWNACNVYFKIDDVKKINGSVEMMAYLIANNSATGNNDIAEIRFLLDDDYTIDMIMMILHPNAQI